jgi:biotin synthase
MGKTSCSVESIPKYVRVSQGSAVVMGLLRAKLDVDPTAAYLMTYYAGRCSANCGFCPQARDSLAGKELLSRVAWPFFSTANVLTGIENVTKTGRIKRVCIQALNYPSVFFDVVSLVRALKNHSEVLISVSCQPMNSENIRKLKFAGVDRIGIALDAATEELFDKVKGSSASGPYMWSMQLRLLQEAVEVFGKGNVSTHLIAGLGESERDVVRIIQRLVERGVLPALFAFTPVRGTAMEEHARPSVESYRRVQLARYLIVNGISSFGDLRFDGDGRIVDFGVEKEALQSIVNAGRPFLTTGCPDCNRPFYNEKPSGPIYNYPRSLDEEEKAEIWNQLKSE